jgi:hypothetical protein
VHHQSIPGRGQPSPYQQVTFQFHSLAELEQAIFQTGLGDKSGDWAGSIKLAREVSSHQRLFKSTAA